MITILCMNGQTVRLNPIRNEGGLALHRTLYEKTPGKVAMAKAGFTVSHIASGYRASPTYLSLTQATQVMDYLLSTPLNWYETDMQVLSEKAQLLVEPIPDKIRAILEAAQ